MRHSGQHHVSGFVLLCPLGGKFGKLPGQLPHFGRPPGGGGKRRGARGGKSFHAGLQVLQGAGNAPAQPGGTRHKNQQGNPETQEAPAADGPVPEQTLPI